MPHAPPVASQSNGRRTQARPDVIWMGSIAAIMVHVKAPSAATIKRLFAVSGNICAFPKCTAPLVDAASGKVTGRVCHIKAASPGGPRYDPGQTDEERHGFENLMLMCGTHHDVIDADEESYTVERLKELKARHEAKGGTAPEPTDHVVAQFIETLAAPGGTSNPTIVTSYQQSGGITAAIVNLNAAPPPGVTARQLFANKPVGSEFHTRVELLVETPYPARNLFVKVSAASIHKMDLIPERGGMVMYGHTGTRPGFAFTNLQSPKGRVYLDVLTGSAELCKVEYEVE